MPQSATPRPNFERDSSSGTNEASTSGVSWGAVSGGAFVAASLSLILLTLGTGLGFSSVSPWSNSGASATAVGAGAVVWLIVTQVLASAMGGYLAGRLRTKWANVHTDEVYFRDTANGLLVWAVGMVLTAAFLTSAAVSFAGSEQKSPNTSASAAEGALNPNAYFIDLLMRTSGAPAKEDTGLREQVARTFDHDLHQGVLTSSDKTYLAGVVSANTGLNDSEADKRVSNVFAEAQEAAEKTRKALAHLSLWLFVALLSGAFSASYAGTIGGRQRDHVIG